MIDEQDRMREVMPKLFALGFQRNPRIDFPGNSCRIVGKVGEVEYTGTGLNPSDAATDILNQLQAKSEDV